ncbi:hypothetical protein [Herbaspirillum rubrisubalbicans]|uniref:hypothetical protein n=1 Tax=Herbaspirillum rubrisubalbicans TaxID=80842 RepID=UPI000DD3A2EC|nr:hypothetical protein [Herbaspirillum rubrisubalbicans]
MNQIQMLKAGVLLAVSIVLTGCATSRSEIKLSEPAAAPAATATVATKNKTVLLRDVLDERIFEEAPSSPSTPSLGFEGSAKSAAEIKARAIGRKRNGFGKALGDVLLENGLTVSDVMRKNIKSSLQQAGFKVADTAADAGNAPIVIDAHVKKFWAWFTPGFWAVSVGTQISTDLVVQNRNMPLVINIETTENHVAVTEGVWIEDIDKALVKYRTEATGRFQDLN